MTNLNKNSTEKLIHLNNEESENLTLDQLFQFINDWLPRNYSQDVNKLLPEEKQLDDTTYIRQVKREKINNPLIVNALYRHAQFYKLQVENTEKLSLEY